MPLDGNSERALALREGPKTKCKNTPFYRTHDGAEEGTAYLATI
ncbi:hypothetical protein EYZ11_004707 [Aspergillus tanneri]|uniref:Uncharacterized protein n=1 Tax=Aspergillus tanneri TaxID=1220188 RepID=A0A4S3JM41_9EURO|nr:hypothetical protein EYZ11_004707 [Aspergillus tanneri]